MTSPSQPAESAGTQSEVPAQLGSTAIHAGAWILVNMVASNGFRIISSVVLTRLLDSEAFGLMQLVTAFMVGLHLFSDVGIGPSIVQSPHGEEQDFLDTAYTVQVFRGTVLWLVGTALSFPFAHYYGDPRLAILLCVINVASFIGGWQSTKLFTEGRRLAQRRLTILDIVIQFAGLSSMIAVAYVTRSVYSLLVGALVQDLIRTVASHFVLPGRRNRLHIHREHLRGMLHFGRWVFISTALTFVVNHSDRLILGKLIPLAMLGVYGIGLNISSLTPNLLFGLTQKLLFPVYSKIHNETTRMAEVFVSARRPLLIVGGFGLAGFVGGGQAAIDLLYDPRYHEAGWVAQVLSVGAWFAVMENSYSQGLLAKGQSRWLAASGAGKLVGMLAFVPAGYLSFGFPGAVVGYAASELGRYAVSVGGGIRHQLVALGQDLRYTALMAAASASGYGASYAVDHFVSHNAALRSIAVFLGVLVVYSPWLRGLLRDLKALRAAGANGAPVPDGAEAPVVV